MRHNQSYKTEQAAITYGGTDHKGCGYKQDCSYSLNIYTHGLGHFISHKEEIHSMRVPEEDYKTGNKCQRKYSNLVQITHGKIPHEPENDIVES